MTKTTSVKLTGETITDEQIRKLREDLSVAGHTDTCYSHDCDIALASRPNGRDPDGTIISREKARARCADILNARNGASS